MKTNIDVSKIKIVKRKKVDDGPNRGLGKSKVGRKIARLEKKE